MRIEELTPGAKFRLAGIPDRKGTLLYICEGCAVVRYLKGRRVRFTATAYNVEKGAHAKVVDLGEVPDGPTTISRATEVESEG